MGTPVGFEGANQVFQAPPGDDNCRDLETFTNGDVVISAWRLSDEELEQVKETGVVWVSVHMGGRTPPIYVSGTALVTNNGKPSRAEPVTPKRDHKTGKRL